MKRLTPPSEHRKLESAGTPEGDPDAAQNPPPPPKLDGPEHEAGEAVGERRKDSSGVDSVNKDAHRTAEQPEETKADNSG